MRNRSLFYKKIFCAHCLGSCKSKKERGVVKYVCSKYDNFGACERHAILESKLTHAINNRYRRELSDEEIREAVTKVVIRSVNLFDIELKEGRAISYHRNGIVF